MYHWVVQVLFHLELRNRDKLLHCTRVRVRVHRASYPVAYVTHREFFCVRVLHSR
jgi:hypothetical protein